MTMRWYKFSVCSDRKVEILLPFFLAILLACTDAGYKVLFCQLK